MYKQFFSFFLAFFALISSVLGQLPIEEVTKKMRAATAYMVDEVSTNGGYVSLYYDDLSRRWGELEAYDSMIWIEGGYGTVAMGNCFLDLYEATGDEYYYEAAEKAVNALIWGQHESGGWHYFIDFAGDRSMREWYRTIGRNAWGFEEHNHYYGNATFDGKNTASAAQLLLRTYLIKRDPKIKPALDKAIAFVLESQYPLGGWPQRYPLKYDFPHGALIDYTHFYTFNDDVTAENLNFLIQCYVALGEARLHDPIHRAMQIYVLTQQPRPQAGWSKQHDMALRPAHARTYEPAAIYPDFTYKNSMLLLRFYELTGDRKYLARVPDAIEFLKSVQQRDDAGNIVYPIFVELGTNKPLYVHRKGTNVSNGAYWWDYNAEGVIQHYKGGEVHVERLEDEFRRLNACAPDEAAAGSPLLGRKTDANPMQDFLKRSSSRRASEAKQVTDAEVRAIIAAMDDNNRWLVKHQPYSLPYEILPTGEISNTARRSDAIGRTILDPSDQLYVSVQAYISNMRSLAAYIAKNSGDE